MRSNKALIPTALLLCLMASSAHAYSAAESLGEASQWLDKAMASYESLESYQSDFFRELTMNEHLRSEEIFMRFEKPGTMYMHWRDGSQRGQQIVYSPGNFEDKLLARPPGFLFSFIPIVHLEKDDPRVTKEETHSIDDAGQGAFLSKFSVDFNAAVSQNQVKILSIADTEIEGEMAKQIAFLMNIPNREYRYTTIAFSKEHFLPVEVNIKKDEDSDSEVFRYLNLEVNQPRENDNFKSSIDRRMFRLYNQIPTKN